MLVGVGIVVLAHTAPVTDEIAPIVHRKFDEGHAVTLHSGSRREMLLAPRTFARELTAAADRMEALIGSRPCGASRPHGGWRSWSMFAGLRELHYRLVGWGWMLWDVDWLRARTADRTLRRLVPRISAGDIVVMHDGDESAPRKPQPQTSPR